MGRAGLLPGDQSRVSASTATPLTRPLLTIPGARGGRIWTLNRKKKLLAWLLGRSPLHSEPQFLHMQNRDDSLCPAYLMGLL